MDKLILAEDLGTGHIYPIREEQYDAKIWKKIPGEARNSNGDPVAPILNMKVGDRKPPKAEDSDPGTNVTPTGAGGSK